MPIPGKTVTSPKQSQLYFEPGTGLTTRPVSVPKKEIQHTQGAASASNSLVAAGTGSTSTLSVNLIGLNVYTINVPLSIPTPLSVKNTLTLIPGAVVISGTWTMVVRSTTAVPMVQQAGSAQLVSGISIAAGTTIQSFIIAVTLNWRGNPPPDTYLIVSCSGSLVTV